MCYNKKNKGKLAAYTNYEEFFTLRDIIKIRLYQWMLGECYILKMWNKSKNKLQCGNIVVIAD